MFEIKDYGYNIPETEKQKILKIRKQFVLITIVGFQVDKIH